MVKGYTYILECADGSYYTGSTKHLRKRIADHQKGIGSNYTHKRIPVTVVYVEGFDRIDYAFNREKQIQGWSKKKKKALIDQKYEDLKKYSECINTSHYDHFDSAQ